LQERGRAHNHSIRAVTALRDLLVDECALQRMRPFRRAEALESDDRLSLRIRDRCLARPGRGAVDHDGAGAALA
jgi:hypothetical protein